MPSAAFDTLKNYTQELRHLASQWQQNKQGDAEAFRIHFLGTKGTLKTAFAMICEIEPQEKKEAGKHLNELKKYLNEIYERLQSTASSHAVHYPKKERDLSLPGIPQQWGNRHPIEAVRLQIVRIFEYLGYSVEEATEIEDEWHNFTALNMPWWHPARDMQDTFYVQQDPSWVLRTHTSNVQVRTMLRSTPPMRMIAPGRVYRNETISARAHCFFHQVEGMYIDEGVSFADLKHSLYAFVQSFFDQDTKVRFRPSYFPFTEPSAEMDISCFFCKQKGCSICKQTGWVEILGCGMMHPRLFEYCHIDTKKYTGFAFGMGVERLTMLRYRINDIRRFSENDVAFLSQFAGVL